MAAIRFFTDEDIYAAIATALRREESMSQSTPEVGRRGQSDESQLEWASAEGRVFFTFNVSHLRELHAAWLRQGRHHAGIVFRVSARHWRQVRRLFHLYGRARCRIDARSC